MRIPLSSRLLLLLVAAVLAVGSLEATDASSDVPGDVNCDNELTIVDPLELLKAGAGLPANDDCAAVNADYTCDETAGVADVPQLLRLIAGLDPESCVPAGTSADGLIDDALENGDITSDEAVLYKLYYVFGDDRLPGEFDVPHDPEAGATGIMKQVGAEYDSLSPQMQQQVGPYLVPPYYVGSWWDLQQQSATGVPSSTPNCMPNFGPIGCPQHPAWSSVSGSLVKVWYPNTFPNGSVHAQGTVSDIENNFWPALQEVMQRTPLSDAGEINNGGDGKLDVTILPGGTSNFVEPYTPNDCSAEPTFMVITGDSAQSVGTETVIHELMHAFQFAFDVQGSRACSEWDWVAEGTAHWAVRHLRPFEEYGNIPARRYLDQTEFSMESSSAGGREYGSWIFWYFLTATNSPDLMFNIWLAGEFHEDSLAGVDSAIPGGWEEQMPKFAQYAWNRPPGDYFDQWLDFDHQLVGAPSIDVEVGLGGEMRYDSAGAPKLEHLGAVYYHYRIDPGVRALGIYNGLRYEQVETPSDSGTFIAPAVDGSFDEVKGLHIWLLQKVDGVWQEPIDWTDSFYQHYCRELPSERVEEVVLIASNSEFEDTNYTIEPPGLPVTVYASDFGCGAWRGTMRTELTSPDGFHLVIEGTGLVFERDPLQIGPWGVSYNVNYILMSGSISWSVDGAVGDCTVSGSSSGLVPEAGRHTLGIGVFFLDGLFHRSAGATVPINEAQHYTMSCPGDPPEDVSHFVSVDFPVTGELDPADDGGATLSGTTTIGDVVVEWHLESGPP